MKNVESCHAVQFMDSVRKKCTWKWWITKKINLYFRMFTVQGYCGHRCRLIDYCECVTVLRLCAVSKGDAGEPNRSCQWIILLRLHWQRHGELKGRSHITDTLLCLFLPICFSVNLSLVTLLSCPCFFTKGGIQCVKKQQQYTFPFNSCHSKIDAMQKHL